MNQIIAEVETFALFASFSSTRTIDLYSGSHHSIRKAGIKCQSLRTRFIDAFIKHGSCKAKAVLSEIADYCVA